MKRVFLAIALAVAAPAVSAATLYSCPISGTAGDQLTRGFYVSNYPGSVLGQVTLNYTQGSGDGAYVVTLTARLGSYSGAIIGSPQTQTVNLVGSSSVPATFDFGGAAVPPGSIVTFSQTLVSGPTVAPTAFYDVGTGACTNITETDGTTPPLDTFRRNSIGLTITDTFVARVAQSAPSLSASMLALLASLLALVGLAARRARA